MPRKSSSRLKDAMPIEPPEPIRREPIFARPPVILAILGTMVVCAAYLWIVQPRPSSDANGNQYKEESKESLDTVSGLISRVSRLIVVKSDETPTIYTVTDMAAFTASWPEAKNVKEGDKVLEWSDKTVVYSPTEDKIVAVLPAFSHEGSLIEEETVVAEEGVTIEIRNGSGIPGSAARLRQQLSEKGFEVARVGDARTRISEGGSIVVDLTNGGTPNALTLLMGAVSGTVANLPEGEPTSDASFLIIIGNE